MNQPLDLDGSTDDVAYLRTARAIRARCAELAERAIAGRSDAFVVRPERMPALADYVVSVLREARPDGPHGRLRHFDAGARRRTRELEERVASLDPLERARVKIDLLVPSVLLDAGAGARWAFRDGERRVGRSEGLALASFELFASGALSGDGASLRCDAEGLARMTSERLGAAFQVTADNPLVGLEERAHTLRALGQALSARPEVFGAAARPGHLLDLLLERRSAAPLSVEVLLRALLDGLAPVFRGPVRLASEPLGDVWPHPALGSGLDGLVPFHKLAQWLAYSLLEPVAEAGLRFASDGGLTSLAEYRNGGLLLDLGVLELVDPSAAQRRHRFGDPLIVEWRALTVHLLGQLEPLVRERAPSDDPPNTGRIEGATWAAGRKIAHKLRSCGGPPLALDSDGTVF